MKKLFASLAIALLFLTPISASAHGAIFTYKYIDGDNLVMVTHNVHDAQAGAPITYNLRLYNMDGQLIPFQQVQTKVQQGGKTVHEQTIPVTQDNEANLVYTYPTEGTYVLALTFLDQDKQIAHGEFPIVVAKGLAGNLFYIITLAVAFVLGGGALKLYQNRSHILKSIRQARTRATKTNAT